MYINYEIIVKEFAEPSVLWNDEDFSIRFFGLRHTKMLLWLCPLKSI